jgi:uncharacterized protein (DUF58 family)
VAGILHGELTTLLWGGAFGFVWITVVVLGAWSGWRLRRTLPQVHPEVSGRPPVIFFPSEPLPHAPPLFSWRLRVEARHSAQRSFTAVLPQSATELAPTWPRGKYLVTARWELADWFGFTRLTVPPRDSAVAIIEPRPRVFSPPVLPEYRRGSSRPRRTGRRSGEPFDVRHYVPGDDLRRLHWPLYAHSDSLFVRTAEPVPPPAGHQFIVLDIAAADETALDVRLEHLTGWLNALDARDSGWTLAVPAAGLTLRNGTGFEGLAALSPSTVPAAIDSSWPETVSVVTGPQGAHQLLNELARSRRRVRPVVIPDETPLVKRQSWWSRP